MEALDIFQNLIWGGVLDHGYDSTSGHNTIGARVLDAFEMLPGGHSESNCQRDVCTLPGTTNDLRE